MGECFVGEVWELFAYFRFDHVFGELFAGGVVGEGEVYFFVENFLAVLEGGVVGFVGAGDD